MPSLKTRFDYQMDREGQQEDAGGSWENATGTEKRDALAAFTGFTVSDPPTEAEVQQVVDYLVTLSEHVVPLINDLIARGGLKGS
ncbi:hypothetical protein GG804_24980 [Sphingomonas histidinilytica]|uniref:hypothetical protein n=1 Tax=Rhizorhabdus histidinilytica TaxID=439228 RepID=UPI001ADCC5B4|nr:hypothetical protein [Rhizorhabdus histidinilytica]MBO9380026.1 hypothetical protein [Rhizorhabdus histidinilytica]